MSYWKFSGHCYWKLSCDWELLEVVWSWRVEIFWSLGVTGSYWKLWKLLEVVWLLKSYWKLSGHWELLQVVLSWRVFWSLGVTGELLEVLESYWKLSGHYWKWELLEVIWS